MQIQVTGRDVFTGEGIRLTLEEGRIVAVEASAEGTADNAPWIAPGLIDLQVNGYAGQDFNSDELDVPMVLRAVEYMLATGVTTFLPTLITASNDKLLANLAVLSEARRAHPLVEAVIPGVHMEGPWISPEDGARGAHSLQHVRKPDLAEFDRWQRASSGLVKLVTLSPHWDGVGEVIATLVRRGVRVSLGHTHAAPTQIRCAVEAGASLSTHLGNGIAAMLPRHPNPIWTQMADQRLTAMFLADGHHLDRDTLIGMLRAKGIAHSILASDLVSLAGMPPGIYDTPVGGRVELMANGRLNLADTELLAGATATLGTAVALVANLPGFSLADAVRMVTLHPAKVLPVRVGDLQLDAIADLLLFHWNPGDTCLRIKAIWKGGKCLS